MRLLLITNVFPNPIQPTRGTFNLEMSRAICEMGHEIEVVSPVSWIDEWEARRKGREIGHERHEVVHGMHVYYPRYRYTPRVLRTWYDWFMWSSVRGTLLPLLRSSPPDAVLAYWAHPDGAVAVRAAKSIGKPCVVMVGGSDMLLLAKQAARRRCMLRALRSADAVVSVSQDIRSKLGEFGIDPSKTHVVYRGVNTEQFSPGDRRAARRCLGMPPDGPLLLWVGRMAPVKGLDVLIDACAILKARKSGFQLMLVGAGPLEKQLRAACLARGLAGQVRFVGPVLHHVLPNWYRAADLTVLPSLSEGVPNVLLESIACGTPFVASRVGGIPEIASSGKDRLVTAGDPVELAVAIEQQLTQTMRCPNRSFSPVHCAVAAERLIEVIHSAQRASSSAHVAPAIRSPASKLGNLTPPWSWRQIARRLVVAGIPKRFLVASGPSQGQLVWLTFDDGPDPEHTPRLLDVLKAHNVRATFFVIGMKAERHPDIVRRMADDGHSVGNHSFCHRSLDELSPVDLASEIQLTNKLLQRLLGKALPIFRPPRGRMKISTLWHLLRTGQQIILWNADPKDHSVSSPIVVSDWFRTHALKAGDIVLLHDNRPFAAVALPQVIKATRERGLEFATLEDPAICRHSIAPK
jgi:peptidoglycan/xylan/chitin deacetylase (PgdA/CDA1 family)/glycosyltransferase involved in cell wall biosynthesis